MGQADPSVQALVAQEAPSLRVTEAGRVECTLNGHSMPAREDIVRAFIE
jgi:Surfeit locus protein 2 (SURF2)